MKTIGLIGGMSWVSTMDYYRYINTLVGERLGGTASAKMMLASVNFAEIEAHQEAGNWDELSKILADIGRSLEAAGADCILICANTMHICAPAVEAAVNIPIIHIADAAAHVLKAQGMDNVALLGTRYTMEKPFLRERLESAGVAVTVPSFAERHMIHNIVYDELVHNIFTDESRDIYINIMTDLQDRGADAMLLACTEIPMLVKEGDTAIPTFDTTLMHAQAAVAFAFGELHIATPQPEPAASIASAPTVQSAPVPTVTSADAIPDMGPINQLVEVFGGESREGFGSAVFVRPIAQDESLEVMARLIYGTFATGLFESFGDKMWGPWKQIEATQHGETGLVVKLLSHDDFLVAMQAENLVLNHDDSAIATATFERAFSSTAITEQIIYQIGDGDALSGLLVASRQQELAVFLIGIFD